MAWCWSPSWRETPWKKADVIVSSQRLIIIVETAAVSSAGTPAPRFGSSQEAKNYATTLNMPAESHVCGDYHCPGGSYDEWVAASGIENNEELYVFGIEMKDYQDNIKVYRQNMPHGLVKPQLIMYQVY